MTNDILANDAMSTTATITELEETGISRSKILSFAHMEETGDYAVDCETGRKAADDLIIWMAETSFTPALATVVQEMMSIGRWTANHIGFFQRLADRSLPAPA